MEEALQQMLALVQSRVTPIEYQVVAQDQDLLTQHKLVTEDILRGTTKQELMQIGFSPGAAAALKKAFPDPPAMQPVQPPNHVPLGANTYRRDLEQGLEGLSDEMKKHVDTRVEARLQEIKEALGLRHVKAH